MSKVIAITGAARGIGLATARALKAGGAKVAIGDIDAAAAAEAGAGLGVPFFTVDVTSRESFTAFLGSPGTGATRRRHSFITRSRETSRSRSSKSSVSLPRARDSSRTRSCHSGCLAR
jgi:hypothetical protein